MNRLNDFVKTKDNLIELFETNWKNVFEDLLFFVCVVVV